MCFFKNFVQLIFTGKSLPFFNQFFCVVDIVISRKGECSEGLGTSFISDMRSKRTRSSTRCFFGHVFVFTNQVYCYVSLLNKFKLRSDDLCLNFDRSQEH